MVSYCITILITLKRSNSHMRSSWHGTCNHRVCFFVGSVDPVPLGSVFTLLLSLGAVSIMLFYFLKCMKKPSPTQSSKMLVYPYIFLEKHINQLPQVCHFFLCHHRLSNNYADENWIIDIAPKRNPVKLYLCQTPSTMIMEWNEFNKNAVVLSGQ